MTSIDPADGITDFGIAQAKHCNFAFCSFALQIDWSKTFSPNNMRCKWLDYSVARWLSPKPVKSCHEKLLNPAKNHVTNFQLKSAKNS